jgi:hypothetical protein
MILAIFVITQLCKLSRCRAMTNVLDRWWRLPDWNGNVRQASPRYRPRSARQAQIVVLETRAASTASDRFQMKWSPMVGMSVVRRVM